MDILYADHTALEAQGRGFTCAKCPVKVQALRRCKEDRWDFTAKDGNVFPIKLDTKSLGSTAYGFCPAKATWYPEIASMANMLMISAETGNLFYNGGMADQPGEYIELLGWFIPRYQQLKLMAVGRMFLGSSSKGTHSGARRTGNRDRGGRQGGHKGIPNH